MQRCNDCSRHVWETESRCPFCSAVFRQVQGVAPVVIAALVGLTLVACSGDDPGAETTAVATMTASSPGTDSMSSTNNVPSSSSSSEMTASATGSTGLPTTTVTSDTSDTSDTTSSTVSTSTSSSSSSSSSSTEGTSTSSDSDSSSTGQTSGTDTTTTTGGDCTGRGEAICGGVCVNTQQDNDHCGKCFNACDPDMGETCNQGECILIMPYGGPMPDPLWV